MFNISNSCAGVEKSLVKAATAMLFAVFEIVIQILFSRKVEGIRFPVKATAVCFNDNFVLILTTPIINCAILPKIRPFFFLLQESAAWEKGLREKFRRDFQTALAGPSCFYSPGAMDEKENPYLCTTIKMKQV